MRKDKIIRINYKLYFALTRLVGLVSIICLEAVGLSLLKHPVAIWGIGGSMFIVAGFVVLINEMISLLKFLNQESLSRVSQARYEKITVCSMPHHPHTLWLNHTIYSSSTHQLLYESMTPYSVDKINSDAARTNRAAFSSHCHHLIFSDRKGIINTLSDGLI